MSGRKKKGLFSNLGKGRGGKKDEETVGGEAGIGGAELVASPLPSGLEIPLIRADDAGAAIDDLHLTPVVLVSGSEDRNDATSASSSPSAVKVVHNVKSYSPSISPTSSTDRISVVFVPEPPPSGSEPFSTHNMATDTLGGNSTDSKVRFSRERHLSALGPYDDDDDELSESLDAMVKRRGSGRRRSTIRRSPKRVASPLGSDLSDISGKGRRRSSTMTSASCEETQISIEEPEMTEEQMFENIKLHKELIESVNKQPWKMKKRLKIVRKAKAYVRKHEGELEQRLAQSKNTKDVMARYSLIFLRYREKFRRQAVNLAKSMIPWEMRIKRIESHFGSAVASYFVFLRWVFWINIVMSIFISCFIIIPEVLAADRSTAGDRKDLLPGDEAKAFNLQNLWDFEGFLRYSPIFYGYYTNKDKTRQGYRIPFAYFMTLLGVYGYSFAAILQRMAENTRQSKLSDKDDDCTFTWKLFTSWDYMIGNSETADNKVASILMGFKENILEEREKAKDEKDWKVWALRVLANLLVLILLVSSAYAVVVVVQRSREPEADDSWWRQNESTVIISLISLLYPNLFDLIGLMENNHPRTQLQLQLARIMILYLLNLYTLIFSLFSKVDEMSAALKLLKPNTTVASTYSTTMSTATSTMSTFPPMFGGGLFPFLVNGTVSPFWNQSMDDFQIPFPGNFTSEILEMFNLSMYYHQLCPWNDTCLAVRANCDTKDYMVISNYSQLYSTASSATSGPSWEFGDGGGSFRSGALNSTYLTLTSLLMPKGKALSAHLIFNTKSQTTTDGGSSETEFSRVWRNRGKTKTRTNENVTSPSVRHPVTYDYGGYRSTRTYKDSGLGYTFEAGDLWPSCWNYSAEIPSLMYPASAEDELAGFYTVAPGYCIILRCLNFSAVTSTFGYDNEVDPRFSTARTVDGTTEIERLNSTISAIGTAATDKQGLDRATREHLRRLCWETMFGQDLVKLTIMDLVMTIIAIVITDFLRALIVRVMNHCCCWDLEKQFPGYGDFKIAENILHLVNNQGMIWMGMFFAPGIPGINMVKIVLIMYVRSWAVLTCNIPHETVFKASNSSNFYYALLLTMLFLCTLPVGYAIVWLEPSWHCGPFSQYSKIYRIFTSSLESILPDIIIRGLGYAASPGIIIPLLVLLILIIYYLNSVANSLREANKDLKTQLRRERTEERRKVFQMADSRHEAHSKWTVTKKILPVLPSKVKMLQLATQQLSEHFKMQEPQKKEDVREKSGIKTKNAENAGLKVDITIKPSQIKVNEGKLAVGVHQAKKEETEVDDVKESQETTKSKETKSKEKVAKKLEVKESETEEEEPN